MRLAIPDLISNSYFPAIAAIELGFMRDEGLDIELDLLFPVTDAAAALRAGEIDLLAGAAHASLYSPAGWSDVKLLCALSHHMYWYLVVKADSKWDRANLTDLRDVRIGAAPGPDLGLVHLLKHWNLDAEERGIVVAPVPGADGDSVSFGVTAAEALRAGLIDAFWANGMGAEVAVRSGVGRVVYDARRGDAVPASFTFPALMTTQRLIDQTPDIAGAAVRAIGRAQDALRGDPSLATDIGNRLFPAMEASYIADLVARDSEFYLPTITESAVRGVNNFARDAGLITGDPAFTDVVATQFTPMWQG